MVVTTLVISVLFHGGVYAQAPSLSVSPSPIIAQTDDNAQPLSQRTPSITYVLERINEERITNAHKRITRDMSINKWTRYALRGASAALMVGAGYIILKWLYTRTSTPAQAELASDIGVANKISKVLAKVEITKKFKQVDQRLDIIEQLYNKPSPSFTSLEYWKRAAISIRDYGIYFVLTPSAVSRTNAAIDGVFINRDIEWFVIQQTSLASQLQAAKYSAQTYTDEKDKEQGYRNYLLLDVCSRMVKQIEMVLAFMRYTRDTLPQTHIELKNVDLMIRYLRNCTDDMCRAVEQFLNKKDELKDKNQLEAIIMRFETEVHNTINRFKDVAHSILNVD